MSPVSFLTTILSSYETNSAKRNVFLIGFFSGIIVHSRRRWLRDIHLLYVFRTNRSTRTAKFIVGISIVALPAIVGISVSINVTGCTRDLIDTHDLFQDVLHRNLFYEFLYELGIAASRIVPLDRTYILNTGDGSYDTIF